MKKVILILKNLTYDIPLYTTDKEMKERLCHNCKQNKDIYELGLCYCCFTYGNPECKEVKVRKNQEHKMYSTVTQDSKQKLKEIISKVFNDIADEAIEWNLGNKQTLDLTPYKKIIESSLSTLERQVREEIGKMLMQSINPDIKSGKIIINPRKWMKLLDYLSLPQSKIPECPHNYKGLWCPECTSLPQQTECKHEKRKKETADEIGEYYIRCEDCGKEVTEMSQKKEIPTHKFEYHRKGQNDSRK